MKNIAVVLAGGMGKRMCSQVPKQFLMLSGRAVIEYSIERFDSHPLIEEVCVVIHPDWREKMEGIIEKNHWQKLKKVVDGGEERYMSTLNAVMAYIDEPDDTNLLIHDAARPMVSAEIVDRVVNSLQTHEAVGVAVPSTDTVWEVHPDFNDDMKLKDGELPRFIARIPERKLMWRAQTPQAFRLSLIRDAYQRALQDVRFQATDDCGVVRKYMPGTKIAVVCGDEQNMKITFANDVSKIENN